VKILLVDMIRTYGAAPPAPVCNARRFSSDRTTGSRNYPPALAPRSLTLKHMYDKFLKYILAKEAE
jgi:hypothetical protein